MLSFNELVKEIISVCENHREIIAAYVFGSRAMGKYKRGSDVDIALLLNDREARDFQYLEFKVKLERALNINVDLIILNNAGEILKHQITKFPNYQIIYHPYVKTS